MQILKKILFGLVGLIVLLAVISQFLPGQVHVERTVTINAAPEAVFVHINNFRNFNQWSPWAPRDPEVKYVFDGPDDGVGARMTWVSDHPQVGSGTQEIIESVPYTRLRTALDFGPDGQAVAFFNLSAEGSGTKVAWGFDIDLGRNPVARFMGLKFDDWIGADYEAGLANLKVLVEAGEQMDGQQGM